VLGLKAPRGRKELWQVSLGVVLPSFWGHVSFLRVTWLFTLEKFLSVSGTWDSRDAIGLFSFSLLRSFCGVFCTQGSPL